MQTVIRQLAAMMVLFLLLSTEVVASPSDVVYQGRLTDASGKPVAGPVDLTIKFFHVPANGVPVLTKQLDDVTLSQGVFNVLLPLNPTERMTVFGNPAGAWVEVAAAGRTYPRQSFNAVPYALNVGVQQGLRLQADDFITTLAGNPAATQDLDLTLPADDGLPNQVLKTDGNGNLYWDAPASGAGNMDGSNNLSELTDDALARTNLGLGDAATRSVGTGAGDVATGNHSHANAGGAAGFMSAGDKAKLDLIEPNADVTDAGNVAAAGAVMDSDYSSNGILVRSGALGTYSVVTNNSSNWNTAYDDRLKWDGEATGLVPATGRASLELGSMAVQNANTVAITGGSITGVTGFASAGIDDNADALAMTIDSNEQVGIGTASPVSLLEVRKDQNALSGAYIRNLAPGGNTGAYAGLSVNVTGTGGGLFAYPTDYSSGNRQDRLSLQVNSDAAGINIEAANAGQDVRIYAGSTTPRMVVASDGSVGLGTSSPNAALDIVGNSAVVGDSGTLNASKDFRLTQRSYDNNKAMIAYSYSNATKNEVTLGGGSTGGYAATALAFNTAADNTTLTGTERMRIDSTGNVGIGTTSPSKDLHLSGDGNPTELWVDTYANGAPSILALRRARGTSALPEAMTTASPILGRVTFRGYDGAAMSQYRAGIDGVVTENWSNTAHGAALVFNTTPNGTVVPEERMRISGDGNVGIGTETPGTTLDLVRESQSAIGRATSYGISGVNASAASILRGARGTIAVPTAVEPGDRLGALLGAAYGGPTPEFRNTLAINFFSSEAHTDTAAGSYMNFETTANGAVSRAERMRISPSGNVGIGTSSPAAMLDVAGTANINSWASQSLGTDGYAKVGSLLFQWGKISGAASENNHVVTFPTAFTAVFNMQCTIIGATSDDNNCQINPAALGTTSATVTTSYFGTGSNTNQGFYWFAIGQ